MENSAANINGEFDLNESDFCSDFELEERPTTPQELVEISLTASKKLLPTKSKNRYEQMYQKFQEWKKQKKAGSNSERVVLAFFAELEKGVEGEKKNVSSTLWAKYSMLKSTMKINDKIDISSYSSLTAFLKQASKTHVPKQAKTFTETQLRRFIDTADDILWLDVKVCFVEISN